MIIRAKIDVTKIDKTALFEGKNGAKYLDLSLLENKNGPDKYGNDFMVTQDIGKQRRENGEKGPILGNAKKLGGSYKQLASASQGKVHTAPGGANAGNDDDSCPF